VLIKKYLHCRIEAKHIKLEHMSLLYQLQSSTGPDPQPNYRHQYVKACFNAGGPQVSLPKENYANKFRLTDFWATLYFFSVKWIPCHHGMARPLFEEKEVLMWRWLAAASSSSPHSRTGVLRNVNTGLISGLAEHIISFWKTLCGMESNIFCSSSTLSSASFRKNVL
jgi:hypothetical protein